MKTKKMIFLALLTATALVIFVAEAQIPAPIPVPGIKLGLSNIIILVTLYMYRRREAAAVMAFKIIIGGLFSSVPSAMLYSAAGGLLCFIVMASLKRVVNEKQLWAISAFGAVGHNAGQLIAAAFILGTDKLWWYAPVLLLSGIVTGVFTGLCASLALPRVKRALKWK